MRTGIPGCTLAQESQEYRKIKNRSPRIRHGGIQFYIILLTVTVPIFFSAILHAKTGFDSQNDFFVIFTALWKNNPPFPHTYPHVHICHRLPLRRQNCKNLMSFLPILRNPNAHLVYIISKGLGISERKKRESVYHFQGFSF